MEKINPTNLDPSELLEKLSRFREEKLDNASSKDDATRINKEMDSFLDEIVKATNLKEFADTDGAKQVIARIEEQINFINSILLLGYDHNGKPLEMADYQSLYDRRSVYRDMLDFFFEPQKVFERYNKVFLDNLVETRNYDEIG